MIKLRDKNERNIFAGDATRAYWAALIGKVIDGGIGYTPRPINTDDTLAWQADQHNDWVIRFFDEDDGGHVAVTYRYQSEDNRAEQRLAAWLEFRFRFEVVTGNGAPTTSSTKLWPYPGPHPVLSEVYGTAASGVERLMKLVEEYASERALAANQRGTPDYCYSKLADPAARRAAVLEQATRIAIDAPKLQVWCGPMPESNGRTNWTAILHRGDMVEGFTLARSEYPHRVRYEADCVRYLIGELEVHPCILDYDSDERTPCHLCGGTGEKDGKPCWGLNFNGTVHHAVTGNGEPS